MIPQSFCLRDILLSTTIAELLSLLGIRFFPSKVNMPNMWSDNYWRIFLYHSLLSIFCEHWNDWILKWLIEWFIICSITELLFYSLTMDDYSEMVSDRSSLPSSAPMDMDQTQLSRLLRKGSRASMKTAWRLIGTMNEDEIRRRSETDNSTYLHQVVSQATDAFKKYGDINHLIPLIYRLALKGVLVNAQNAHGNTCLHLACLRPNAERLCPHLIRIGRPHFIYLLSIESSLGLCWIDFAL